MRIWLLAVAMAGGLLAADVAGRYELRGEREMGCELVLQSDGHFSYMMAYGAADYSAQGTWKREGSAVVLTTGGKDEPPFRLVRVTQGAEAGTRIWIKTSDGRGVPHIDVVMNDVTARTSSEGVAAFGPEVKAAPVRMAIRVYGFEAGPYELKAPGTDYEFEINGTAITTVRFKGERLLMQGDELLLRYGNPQRAMRLVRVANATN